jgi:ribosomal protein S18 acetylase RimI-like enzyme
MEIRALRPEDAAAFQALRLQGLLECPAAFASSHAEEVGTALTTIAERLATQDDRALFGAFDAGVLAGTVGIQRESMRKLAHKAHVWGVYVAPPARGAGIGRALLTAALGFAATTLGVRQVTLGVNGQNAAAIALYRSLGFETFGVERGFLCVDGVLHDELHMVCIL